MQSMQGAKEAFGLLVVRHARLVRAICLARLGNRELDDAVQEIFLRAYKGLPRLRNPKSFHAFLAQIARNYCVDRLRNGSKQEISSLEEVDLEPADQETLGEDHKEIMLERLRSEVSRLPESQREILLLFYFHKLSYAEMASTLRISEAAVNQRLSRARSQLRSAFQVEPGRRG